MQPVYSRKNFVRKESNQFSSWIRLVIDLPASRSSLVYYIKGLTLSIKGRRISLSTFNYLLVIIKVMSVVDPSNWTFQI